MSTTTVGGTSVRLTVASSLSVSEVPSLSTATAVTVSVSLSPAFPKKSAAKKQEYVPPLAGMDPPVTQVPCPLRLPWMLSTRDVSVTASNEWLVTTTVKVNEPPGSGRVSCETVLSTEIFGRTLVSVTIASSLSVAGVSSSSIATAVTVLVWLAPALPVNVPGKVQV